jgi:hypothetical protein
MNNWREGLNLVQEDISQLMAIKERFENQKKRAEALRDGVSLTARNSIFSTLITSSYSAPAVLSKAVCQRGLRRM